MMDLPKGASTQTECQDFNTHNAKAGKLGLKRDVIIENVDVLGIPAGMECGSIASVQ